MTPVGLQAGQNQIEGLLSHGISEHVRDRGGVGRSERLILDVNRAVGASRQRFPQHLRDARGPGGADDDLAAVLLLEAQGFLERVGVRLVELPARVLFANVRALRVQAGLPLAGRNLLDADSDFHGVARGVPTRT